MKKLLFILLGMGFMPSIASACSPDLELAGNLILEGKPEKAYGLLEPCEFEMAGTTKYDYLLGLAALNSGQPGKAGIILERVLVVDPLYAAAWVDLGRANYLSGDLERARTEFIRAQALNPPQAAQVVLNHYLQLIDNRKPDVTLSSYFELGAGYNNNVNNSTDQSQILLPILLNTQMALNANNIKTADRYLGLAAGAEVVQPVSANWSIYANLNLRSRSGSNYRNFNFVSLDGGGGVSFQKGSEQLKGGVVAGQFDLGGATNRKSGGYNVEWIHGYSNFDQALLFAQQIRYRYPDPMLTSNDFNQLIAGFGWVHTFADASDTVSGSFYTGNESDTHLRIDGGKRLLGLRLSWQSRLAEKLDMFALGSMQRANYQQINSTFLVVRADQQAELVTGLNYHFAHDWLLRPQLSLLRNNSNIVIDGYTQADFMLSVRYDFR